MDRVVKLGVVLGLLFAIIGVSFSLIHWIVKMPHSPAICKEEVDIRSTNSPAWSCIENQKLLIVQKYSSNDNYMAICQCPPYEDPFRATSFADSGILEAGKQ